MTFLLYSALVAVLGGAALLLRQAYPDNDRVELAIKGGLVVLGAFWMWRLWQRLGDAALPRWLAAPYSLAVLGACYGAHARGILDGPETLVFFLIVQVPTILFPSRARQSGAKAGARDEGYPEYNRPVGRWQFLLRVVLIAGLFAALLALARAAGPAGVTAWEMRFGVVLFALLWIYSVEGRVMDAGLPRWYSIIYCVLVPGASALPHFLKLTSLHAALVLFVVLQTPTVLIRRRIEGSASSPMEGEGREDAGLPDLEMERAARPGGSIDGVEFGVYVALIAGLLYVLHLLRADAGPGKWSWIAQLGLDAGALFVCALWLASVSRRLRDAGLEPWIFDFVLVVLAVSLLPLAFGVIGFPPAVILFAALQIPAVFLRRGAGFQRQLSADRDC